MSKATNCLILCLMGISFFAGGQDIKSKTKKAAGQTRISFHPVIINNQTRLKSGSGKSFYVSSGLQLPGTGTETYGFDKIIYAHENPVFIEKSIPDLKSATLDKTAVDEVFRSFTDTIKSEIRINQQIAFEITGQHTGPLGMIHIRSVQKYNGVPVYGSESGVHISPEKIRFTGTIHNIHSDLDTQPDWPATQALEIALRDLETRTVIKTLTPLQKEILHYEAPMCHLVVMKNQEGTYTLAYEMEIRPNFLEVWKYFVDAENGKIIRSYNATVSDGPVTATAYDLNGILRTIDTYLENGVYYLINTSEEMFNTSNFEGSIVTFDAGNTSTNNLDFSQIWSSDNTWNHPKAVSAHYHATLMARYLKNTFNRNSLNDLGGSIISFVNVANDDGSSMPNAFWNGYAAFYGNGGTSMKPLSGALDISAHELGHGVVSNTANLEYYGQSGAMNEMYADIFGAMVDRDDWFIGEDATLDGTPMRNMQDPANGKTHVYDGWLPKHMSELVTGDILDNFIDRDYEGVHINCGIGIYAYYLYATAISKNKAEQVFYRALTVYLNKTSQYLDLRIAVIQAANDLFGNTSPEAVKAAESFDAVGIYQEQQVEYTRDYEENPGQDYILSYDTNEGDPYTLYKCSTSGTNFVGLTTTDMKGKVSVTDDGSFAVFVSKDHKIRGIDLTTNEEWIISDEAFWDNAAISKDGMRLAGISTEIDTAIYVYDFNSAQWGKFILYNPTTSNDNSIAGGVLYGDIIEFDHTGEYLMYDAINILNSSTSEPIYYWDIGFIKVWNNQTQNFGNGTISKLFESLPENISIGNPVFSKNSPYIVAFDYIHHENEEYAIIGANLNSGETNTLYQNVILGYPSFSKKDDQLAFSALNTRNEKIAAVIGLAEDKITPSGSASVLINNAQWPVYYATGSRPLGLQPVSRFTADYKSGKAPLEVRYFDLSVNTPTSWLWSFEGGTPSSSTQQNPVITYHTPGIYEVSLTTQNIYGSDTQIQSAFMVVSDATGIDEAKLHAVGFYPNPVTDMLFIESGEPVTVSLYNLNGKKLISRKDTRNLDVSSLAPGVYLLEMISGEQVIREKILKQNP